MSTGLLVVCSGTLGDVLPVARLVSDVQQVVPVDVITNETYKDWFPRVRSFQPLQFDPGEVIASRAGQRMIQGGALGWNRLSGIYGVVHPQIRPTVDAVSKRIGTCSRVLVAGIPFGVGEIAAAHGTPVTRLLYQPHWPTDEVKSLYANTAQNWPRWMNRASHEVAELVAQCFFRRRLNLSLRTNGARSTGWAANRVAQRLLHDSYYQRHETLLSLPRLFAHRTLIEAQWASFPGFIRPPSVERSVAFDQALSMLSSPRRKRPLVYCGFGSMASTRSRRVQVAVAEGSRRAGVQLVTQGGNGAELRRLGALTVPFGDHRQLFPLCSGMVHHGGAGTVVASLDAGSPFCIVPQWADQFFWFQRCLDLGLSVNHDGGAFDPDAWSNTLRSMVDGADDAAASDHRRSAAGTDGFKAAACQLRNSVI